MTTLSRRRVLTGAAAVLTVAASAGAGRAPVEHEVEIGKFRFAPESLAVRPGDRITWTNRDLAPHTATARDESWDTGTLRKGESATVEVGAGMSGAYFCQLHPTMKAALVVAPKA